MAESEEPPIHHEIQTEPKKKYKVPTINYNRRKFPTLTEEEDRHINRNFQLPENFLIDWINNPLSYDGIYNITNTIFIYIYSEVSMEIFSYRESTDDFEEILTLKPHENTGEMCITSGLIRNPKDPQDVKNGELNMTLSYSEQHVRTNYIMQGLIMFLLSIYKKKNQFPYIFINSKLDRIVIPNKGKLTPYFEFTRSEDKNYKLLRKANDEKQKDTYFVLYDCQILGFDFEEWSPRGFVDLGFKLPEWNTSNKFHPFKQYIWKAAYGNENKSYMTMYPKYMNKTISKRKIALPCQMTYSKFNAGSCCTVYEIDRQKSFFQYMSTGEWGWKIAEEGIQTSIFLLLNVKLITGDKCPTIQQSPISTGKVCRKRYRDEEDIKINDWTINPSNTYDIQGLWKEDIEWLNEYCGIENYKIETTGITELIHIEPDTKIYDLISSKLTLYIRMRMRRLNTWLRDKL